MPLIGEIGDTREMVGEIRIEWQIQNFFSLSIEDDSFYESPIFGFSNACWCLRIYPNGVSSKNSTGFLGLHLVLRDSGLPKSVNLTFNIKGTDGETAKFTGDGKNLTEGMTIGWPQFISRIALQNQMTKLMLSNILTIICIVKHCVPHNTKTSLFSRLLKFSRDMKASIDTENRKDFTIQLSDCKQSVHKVILENRCDYFKRMFGNDWLENNDWLGNLSHIEGEVFKNVQAYLYSGDIENLNEENVCNIYLAAHELQLEELKALCIEVIKEKMSLKIICDVLHIVEKYEDQELRAHAMKFLANHAEEVFASVEWEEFIEANSPQALRLVEKLVVERMKPTES